MDGRFTWTRLRGISRLTLGRMLETAVGDGSYKLIFQQEIAETGGVDTDVAAFLFAGGIRCCEATFGSCCITVGRSLRGLDILVGVVNEIFLVRHDVDPSSVVCLLACGRLRKSKLLLTKKAR